jgi:signal transduction histidine kinase
VRECSQEQRHHFLTIIDTEIKRLTRLINDFLDLQRLEAGAQQYDLADHDLCELVRHCVEITGGSGASHTVLVDLPPSALHVHVDADRIRQVLMNLLSNAVKFSPDGGAIHVRGQREGDRVEVSIRDQGIGMSPDVVQKLFRKFYRADADAVRFIEGTGLGLALVREILTTHNGEIWVESQVGAGSEFFFTLPAHARMASGEKDDTETHGPR